MPEKVLAVDAALHGAGVPHAVGGGLALAYYAEPRVTTDIDVNLFLPAADWEEVAAALEPLGVAAGGPGPPADLDSGRCELRWGRTAVDLFFATEPIHDEMSRTVRRLPFAGMKLPFVAPEFLAAWKARLDRPRDWIDIEQMLLLADPFDSSTAKRWLARMIGEDDPRSARLRELDP